MTPPTHPDPSGGAGPASGAAPRARERASVIRRVRRALARHGAALAAGGAGLVWFLLHVGPAVLDPTHVAWLMRGDWAQNYFGWAFFRRVPLQLPLGVNPDYPFAVGSALAYSDSNPLVGVLLRPLSGLLPDEFQYVGPWLALCFALQGFVGAKLVRLATDHRLAQALGGALFALAPPLLHRVVGPLTGHASLSAHWLVLAFLWLALAPVDARHVVRRLAAAAGLGLVASGVHPYHVVAGVLLSLALVLRLWAVDRLIGWRAAAASAAGFAATAALGLLAFGYFLGGVSTAAIGFGAYSADGLALVSPMGWSRLWRGLPVGRGQYEGFAYLGAGVFLAAVAGVAAAFRARARLRSHGRAALPAAGAAFLLAAFSLSDTITVAGKAIVRVSAYGWFPALGDTFRSSGRFLWSLHYLVVLAAIAAIAVGWRSRPRLVAAALGTALALQAVDVSPPVPMETSNVPWARASSDAWAAARGRYRHVALVPPYLVTGSGGGAARECPAAFPPGVLVTIADVAYRISATFNSAYLARMDRDAAAAACVRTSRDLGAGRLDPETIYVVHREYETLFRAAGASCGTLDGMPVCVHGDRRDAFSEALRPTGAGDGPRPTAW